MSGPRVDRFVGRWSYEEAEGFTEEHVKTYLRQNGWCNLPDENQWLLKPFMVPLNLCLPMEAMQVISSIEKCLPREMIRRLNPRLRPGIPTAEEWAAHGGDEAWWVAVWERPPVETGHPAFEVFRRRPMIVHLRRRTEYGDEEKLAYDWGVPGTGFSSDRGRGAEWSFWPCDSAGNKVSYSKLGAPQ